MKRSTLRWAVALLLASGLTLQVRADSLTNNFNVVSDYVLNGIIGETNWDGVYLGFGDILNGGVGGSGQGASLQANTSLQTGTNGFLSIQTIGSDWGGNGDDGFYAWKLVSGDFDVSVENVPPWTSQGNNFAGLLIRAWNTNQSGARISFTSTNSSENYLQLWRDQEFAGTASGGSQIRQTTNGTDIQYNTAGPGVTTDTNSARFFRITRTGDMFTFYWKTNQGDPWSLINNAAAGNGYVPATGSISRPDWTGQPVQVGIAQAIFARPGTPAVNFFTDFELSGPNVKAPPSNLPAAPDTLVTSSPNPNGSLTFSWNTNGGTGSMLIIRKINTGGVLVVNPVQGLTYNSDTNFQSTNTFIAGNTHVVYAGSSNSVVVGGLAGSNNLYIAEVVSYNNTGSIIYNTAQPATTTFLGSGVPSSIAVTINPTNIPMGGVGVAKIVATFTTGDQVDVSSDPSVMLSSSDPTIIAVNGSALNGLQPGSATITATYAGFSGQVNVSVTPYRFTDNFSVSQDYLNKGLPGSAWDGIYDRPGDVSGTANFVGGPVVTSNVDANVTAPNTLTVTAGSTDWAGAGNDGFFLFKNVTGDFQAMVHVTSITRNTNTNSAAIGDGGVGFMFAGLLARAAITNGAENWVYWSEFDQFSDSTEARFALNGGDNERPMQDGLTKTNYWLLMQRVNGTNFFFYRKVNATDLWENHPEVAIVQPNLTNSVALQVGLFQATYTGNSGTVQFDSFALDANGLVASPPLAPPGAPTNLTMTLNPDISMTLQWTVPGTNSDGSAFRSMVVMRANAPVSAQPTLNLALGGDVANPSNPFGLATDNLGSGNYIVYRSPAGLTNLTQQCIVTGLSPGVQYYASVYTFILGTSRVFNTASGLTAGSPTTSLVDGTLIGLQSSLFGNGIPLGGIGIPIVNGVFTGGGLAVITPAVNITSDNTNVVLVSGNVLSGMALGSTTVHISYSGFTNVLSAVVRNPGFTDNFSTSQDYVANGVTNTAWDGVYLGANSFTNEAGGNDGVVSAADANITTNNTLTVTHTSTDWAGTGDDGFLLFKNVTGDFQASVHMTSLTKINYQFAGIMARGYSTNGPLTVGTNAPSENWIYWGEFEQFNDSTEGRRALNGVDLEHASPTDTVITNNWWLLLNRQNGTNFTFYRKLNPTDPWSPQSTQAFVQTNLATGVPVQVGLFAAMYTANVGTAEYDSFMLDVIAPTLTISPSGTTVTVSWLDNTFALQSTPSLNPVNWQPVPQSPTFTNGQYSVQLPITATNQFYRLIR